MKYSVIMSCILLSLLGGCTHGKKTLSLAGAGLLGGGAGYALFDKSPIAAGVGAVAGAVVASAYLGEDEEVLLESYNEGYIQGSSNAIKRQYWLKQALEAPSVDGARMTYYTIPANTQTEDGRFLVDHNITVPIVE